MKNSKVIFTILLCFFSLKGFGQFYHARTNLIGLGSGNINVELGLTLDRHFSLHIPLQYNPFYYSKRKNTKFQNLTVLPGARYWFRESFREQFVGLSLVGSRYNIGNVWDNYRYDGYGVGVGFSFGWAYPMSPRWNIEWEVGAAALWASYEKFVAKNSGWSFGKYREWKTIPHKAAVSLIYLF